MTVKDLRRMLTLVPDDATVIVAKDTKGNDFKLLDDLEAGNFERLLGYTVFMSEDEINVAKADGSDAKYPFNAVCLWPE